MTRAPTETRSRLWSAALCRLVLLIPGRPANAYPWASRQRLVPGRPATLIPGRPANAYPGRPANAYPWASRQRYPGRPANAYPWASRQRLSLGVPPTLIPGRPANAYPWASRQRLSLGSCQRLSLGVPPTLEPAHVINDDAVRVKLGHLLVVGLVLRGEQEDVEAASCRCSSQLRGSTCWRGRWCRSA